MKDVSFEYFDPYNQDHKIAAAKAGYYSTFAQMLPLSRKRIESFDYSVMAFGGNHDVFLGHVAVKLGPYRAFPLLSGLITNPLFGGEQLGDSLMEYVAADVPEQLGINTLYAYANNDSLKLFERQGAVEIGLRPGKVTTGCNHIVDLTPMLQPVAAEAMATGGAAL